MLGTISISCSLRVKEGKEEMLRRMGK